MEKKISIKDLRLDQTIVDEYFVLKELEKKLSKQDNYYYNVLLADKTGEIRAKIWPDSIPNCDVEAKVGGIVVVSGVTQEYAGKLQFIINKMAKAEGIAPEEFLVVTDRDRAMMKDKLEEGIKGVQNPHYRKLLDDFWNDSTLRDLYLNYPAAEYVHHAYIGGLLEHVYEMYLLSEPYFVLYPELDRDLFFTGLFFHDIGKLEEYEIVGATIGRTTPGNLVSHIVQGVLIVDRMIQKIPDFPELARDKLFHLILSHQGKLEYGSPVKPQMLEALVLSMVDVNGAEMNQARKHIEKQADTEGDFTDYHKYLGRSLWMGD